MTSQGPILDVEARNESPMQRDNGSDLGWLMFRPFARSTSSLRRDAELYVCTHHQPGLGAVVLPQRPGGCGHWPDFSENSVLDFYFFNLDSLSFVLQ